MNTIILSFLISFLFVYLTMPLFRKLAVKFEILDLPGHRKIHLRATPLLGGLAIYLGLLIAILFNFKYFNLYIPILVGATIMLIVGLMDDIKGLSAPFRLFCQMLAALIVIGFGFRISFLPFGIWKNIGEIIITLIWILGVTNAYNYLDGMNGLATGSAIINLFFFIVILDITQQYSLELLAIILLAACLGFLPYNNIKKAKIFLGDAGSMFLGFMLAGISLAGVWAEDNIVKISIPILILGVPIFDMIFTTIMRVKEEKVKTILGWLQYGGKDHFHHYLVDLGLNPSGAVVFIYCITFSLGISAIMINKERAIGGVLSLSQAAIIFGIIAVLIVVGKRRRSGWKIPNKKIKTDEEEVKR